MKLKRSWISNYIIATRHSQWTGPRRRKRPLTLLKLQIKGAITLEQQMVGYSSMKRIRSMTNRSTNQQSIVTWGKLAPEMITKVKVTSRISLQSGLPSSQMKDMSNQASGLVMWNSWATDRTTMSSPVRQFTRSASLNERFMMFQEAMTTMDMKEWATREMRIPTRILPTISLNQSSLTWQGSRQDTGSILRTSILKMEPPMPVEEGAEIQLKERSKTVGKHFSIRSQRCTKVTTKHTKLWKMSTISSNWEFLASCRPRSHCMNRLNSWRKKNYRFREIMKDQMRRSSHCKISSIKCRHRRTGPKNRRSRPRSGIKEKFGSWVTLHPRHRGWLMKKGKN